MNPLHVTDHTSYATTVQSLRDVFDTGKTKGYKFRISQLQALKRMVENEESLIIDALAKDLGRCKFEAVGLEILGLIAEIDLCIKNLSSWMEPNYTSVRILLLYDCNLIT